MRRGRRSLPPHRSPPPGVTEDSRARAPSAPPSLSPGPFGERGREWKFQNAAVSASSRGGAGCGREREAWAVEPGSSLGLVEVAAPPLAKEDMMGTGRGGPLLEGSEAGYKRRGGGRKPVSLDAPAAFQVAEFFSTAGPTLLVSKAYVFLSSMVSWEHVGRCRLHGFAAARDFLSISGRGWCVRQFFCLDWGLCCRGEAAAQCSYRDGGAGLGGKAAFKVCGEKGAAPGYRAWSQRLESAAPGFLVLRPSVLKRGSRHWLAPKMGEGASGHLRAFAGLAALSTGGGQG